MSLKILSSDLNGYGGHLGISSFGYENLRIRKTNARIETWILKTRTKALVDSLCFPSEKTAPAARHTGVVYFAFY